MKIERFLPQFSDQSAIIVAVGRQTAKMYAAASGSIELISEITEETPRYSDREGRFDKRKRKYFISGSVYEDKNEYVKNKFFSNLIRKIKSAVIEYRAEKVYIFRPAHLKGLLEEKMPPDLMLVSVCAGEGNYVRYHPFFLLEMIKDHFDRERDRKIVRPLKPEAAKLLKKLL